MVLKCLYAPGDQNGVFQSIMHASALSALGNSPISATGLAELKGGRQKGFHYTNIYKQRGYIYICICVVLYISTTLLCTIHSNCARVGGVFHISEAKSLLYFVLPLTRSSLSL